MRYHLTPARMAIIKNPQTINAGKGVERRESSYTVGGDVNWYSHYEEQYGGSLKKSTTSATMEKEMATHSSVLAWRIPGTGEPGGQPSMGSQRVRHD